MGPVWETMEGKGVWVNPVPMPVLSPKEKQLEAVKTGCDWAAKKWQQKITTANALRFLLPEADIDLQFFMRGFFGLYRGDLF